MHIRTNITRRNGKVYQYAQLVKSVRDKNGNSTTRIVKHLGLLPNSVIEAFKIALRASSQGESLVLQSEVPKLLEGKIVANKLFLNLAVLIDCWRQWGLDAKLRKLSPNTDTTMPFEKVILSLVLQRCSAPGSKLGATRWIKRTALPELLGFNPKVFNNSRIHRVLTLLHEATPALQSKLAKAYKKHGGDFGVLFMDVTDTYFEGIGPPLAEQTRTKTEMPNKRCIAIVMLVNEHGFPLRWQLVGGKTKDWTAMSDLTEQLKDVSWIKKTPIVFDRAMGNRCTVTRLFNADLRFLTAAHRTAIDSYTAKVPRNAFKGIEIEGTDKSYKQDINLIAQAARDAGFEEIEEKLFVMDLGVSKIPPVSHASKYIPREQWRGRPNKMSENLRLAEKIKKLKQDNPKMIQKELAQSFGISLSRLRMVLALKKLCPEIQQQIHKMNACFPVPEKDIIGLLDLEASQQNKNLKKLMKKHKTIKSGLKSELKNRKGDEDDIKSLRLVAYFNPQLFVDTRCRTAGHCELLQKRAAEFNQELANAKKTREWDPTYRRFARELERLNYFDTFKIHLEPIEIKLPTGKIIKSFKGNFIRDIVRWEQRRKYDGFVLLLGHPELLQSAAQLVAYYRGKDVVEKGFQSIKSFIHLRPVYHYTDSKIKAHVSVCMLALLLMRTLRQRLRQAGLSLTEENALEILTDCYLNKRDADIPIYQPTKLNPEQAKIIGCLKLQHLLAPRHLKCINNQPGGMTDVNLKQNAS